MQTALISIQAIEAAINYWRDHEPGEALSLGPTARRLADVYGMMIFDQATSISADKLDERQRQAILTAQEHAHAHAKP